MRKQPGFLVIGAMKCGTTTLYRDLRSQPSLHLPEKEANLLTAADFDPHRTAHRYALLYKRQSERQLGGDVSTTYSMLPDYAGVPERAHQVLGRDLRLIYVVRNPVTRAVSHHYHMYSRPADVRRMAADIDECVQLHPQIIDFSRYAMQLDAWREFYPDDQIYVVIFEEYISNRRRTIVDLCNFLDVSCVPEFVEVDRAFNQSDGKPVLNHFWAAVQSASWYRKAFRPVVPEPLKNAFMRWALPTAPPRPAPPSPETVGRILSGVQADAQTLADTLKRSQPIWNLAVTAQQIVQTSDPLAA